MEPLSGLLPGWRRPLRGNLQRCMWKLPNPENGRGGQEPASGHIRLAKKLGAKIETTCGDDIAFQISEFARLSGVTKIVIGRSMAERRHLFGKPPLTEKLITNAPNMDIYIIPCQMAENRKFSRKNWQSALVLSVEI